MSGKRKPANTENDGLFGNWIIESVRADDASGGEDLFGPDPEGFVRLDRSGRMAFHVSASNKPLFKSEDYFLGTSEEQRFAFENNLGFGGRFTFNANEITYVPEISTFFNQEDVPITNQFEIQADRLIVTQQVQKIGKRNVRPVFEYRRDTRPRMQFPPNCPPIVGYWRMSVARLTFDDGRILNPNGIEPNGFLWYDAYGREVGMQGTPGRVEFASGDFRDGTDAEIENGYRHSFCYSGRYSVDMSYPAIIHHPEISMCQNWVGQDQYRFFEFEGDNRMLFSSRVKMHGGEANGLTIWDRMI